MKNAFLISLLILIGLKSNSQCEICQYLDSHHYKFTLEKGFDKNTSEVLKEKLGKYKVILQAEGGSHYLDIYDKLSLLWINFLNREFHMTHYFLECGHASDILINKYLKSGDTYYLYIKDHVFWKALYEFNKLLDSSKQLKCFGIDHEQKLSFVKGLKLLIPDENPPKEIQSVIDLLKNTPDTTFDCSTIDEITNRLRESVKGNKEQFIKYLGSNYCDFEHIIFNKKECHDYNMNKNKNMNHNFLSFDEKFKQPIYFGELGQAHTSLRYNSSLASHINSSDKFKDKICVINLYCNNCSSIYEQTSNWTFQKIDDDIRKYFLPLCTSEFTLFDLSENIKITEKYRRYGQFLIIANNSH